MPVDSIHPQYSAMREAWTRCIDAAAGTDAVKARQTEYLPKLSGQTNEDYIGYLKRALFYPATDRTISGLVGAVMRRPPVIRCPEPVLEHMADVTLSDDPLIEFIFNTLYAVLLVGRTGILLDMTRDPAPLARPYWIRYEAQQIINWQTKLMPDGTTALTLVVLKEEAPTAVQRDPFVQQTETRYRVLALLNGQYVVTTWSKNKDQNTWVMSDAPIFPTRRGEPLTFIPFVIVGPRGVSTDVDKPPLLDLVDVNLSHYRNSADLEHGRHFVALPTPYITGWVEPQDGARPLRIGAGTAWTLPNPDANVGMLEFTGQGLKALEIALEQKEKMMAVLGARMLEQQPRQGETAETVRLRQSGEHAVLGSIASAISQGLTKVLRWHTWWSGFSTDVAQVGPYPDSVEKSSIELNHDFFETTMDANEAKALMELWQQGAISYETLYWNLQRGEWARPNISSVDERELIGEKTTEEDSTEGSEAVESETGDEESNDLAEAVGRSVVSS